MGRDTRPPKRSPRRANISIHSPRMGRDTEKDLRKAREAFQSTLPAWGETNARLRLKDGEIISIHSPRMGRDFITYRPSKVKGEFQSTLPAWGETCVNGLKQNNAKISIHSPRMGRDCCISAACWLERDFNPLSPHGERLMCQRFETEQRKNFNPLSPHGERRGAPARWPTAWGFQSTLPAWGETQILVKIRMDKIFQSTLPAWGETFSTIMTNLQISISIHSPRMGRDVTICCYFISTCYISIHSPRMGRD